MHGAVVWHRHLAMRWRLLGRSVMQLVPLSARGVRRCAGAQSVARHRGLVAQDSRPARHQLRPAARNSHWSALAGQPPVGSPHTLWAVLGVRASTCLNGHDTGMTRNQPTHKVGESVYTVNGNVSAHRPKGSYYVPSPRLIKEKPAKDEPVKLKSVKE